MNKNFKDIHIGELLMKRVSEREISISRICNFLDCTENEILETYKEKSIDIEILLRWSKLLEYDFFRIYSHHLILYSPPASKDFKVVSKSVALPQFKKSVYTKEVIDFVIELVNTGIKSKTQVTEEYKIPKTTLYKWISKYNINNE